MLPESVPHLSFREFTDSIYRILSDTTGSIVLFHTSTKDIIHIPIALCSKGSINSALSFVKHE